MVIGRCLYYKAACHWTPLKLEVIIVSGAPHPVSRGSCEQIYMVPRKMLRKQIFLLVHYMAVVITKYPLVTQEAKNEELPSWARGISWVLIIQTGYCDQHHSNSHENL